MNLKNIMSKDIIVGSVNDNIVKIANIMKENDIGFVPISDDNKIVGVITDRDIVVNIVSNGDIDCDINNYMTKNIISINVNANIKDALSIMKKNKVKRIIVEEDKRIVGILSISDIISSNQYSDLVLDSIKEIWKIGPNIHKYETEIDEFYL